jgi:hypothetical protein
MAIVAKYPYLATDRLSAAGIKSDLEFSPSNVPPASRGATPVGAGRYKWWIDLSTTLPTLRMCTAAAATPTYVDTEWMTLATIDAPNKKWHFNPDFVDFSGGSSGQQFQIGAPIYSSGPSAALFFQDRTVTNHRWVWYAQGDQALLQRQTTSEGEPVNWITVNYSDGVANFLGGLIAANTVTSIGTSAGFNWRDRSTNAQWMWYASGNVARLWFYDGVTNTEPFAVWWDGSVNLVGNHVIRSTGIAGWDGATRFQSAVITEGAHYTTGNHHVGGGVYVSGGVNAGGTIDTQFGDIRISRTNQQWGYVLRPNVGGVNYLGFATDGAQWLEGIQANTHYLKLYTNYNDVNLHLHTQRRLWGLAVLGDGTDRFGIADHSGGAWRLLIDTTGKHEINTHFQAYPLWINANNSDYCLIRYNSSQRQWDAGANDSRWLVRDESAGGVVRFAVDASGNTNIYNDLWFPNRTSVYNIWDLFTLQLYFGSPGDYGRQMTSIPGGEGIQTNVRLAIGDIGIRFDRLGSTAQWYSFGYEGMITVWINGGYWFGIPPSSSDERLKTNIIPSEIDALSLINQLEMIEFDRSDLGQTKHFKVGVRGQQLDELMSDTVFKGRHDAPIPDQIQVDNLALSGYMLKAIQQLTQRLEALEGGV